MLSVKSACPTGLMQRITYVFNEQLRPGLDFFICNVSHVKNCNVHNIQGIKKINIKDVRH